MPTMKPFADDCGSIDVAGLTVENGVDRLALYGTVDLTLDKVGLVKARQILELMLEIVKVMEGATLQDSIPPPEKPIKTKNPFA